MVGAAPPERAGAASAISETGAELGGALGIAVLGSIGTAVYRSQVPDTLPAAGRDTLGGAVQAAARMPERVGAPLLDAARAAFTHGLQVMSGVCVAVVLASAVITALLLRRTGDEPQRTDPFQSRPSAPFRRASRAAARRYSVCSLIREAAAATCRAALQHARGPDWAGRRSADRRDRLPSSGAYDPVRAWPNDRRGGPGAAVRLPAPPAPDGPDHARRPLEWLADHWDLPEAGIWETRGGPKAFTYGRVMSWVAFDRAIRMARRTAAPAPMERWLSKRDAIYEQVMMRGWNSGGRHP